MPDNQGGTLDLAASLSTEDFLATLERFIARRGSPAVIYSNNGTNFQGARKEIREIQKFSRSRETTEALSQFATVNQIDWKHIPPRTPHFGGLWEAAVKAMKVQLRKNLKPHTLRWDKMYSVLTGAEAILNSPTCSISLRRNFRRLLPDSWAFHHWKTPASSALQTFFHLQSITPPKMESREPHQGRPMEKVDSCLPLLLCTKVQVESTRSPPLSR